MTPALASLRLLVCCEQMWRDVARDVPESTPPPGRTPARARGLDSGGAERLFRPSPWEKLSEVDPVLNLRADCVCGACWAGGDRCSEH